MVTDPISAVIERVLCSVIVPKRLFCSGEAYLPLSSLKEFFRLRSGVDGEDGEGISK